MPMFDPASLARAVTVAQQGPTPSAQTAQKAAGIGVAPYLALESGQGADLATTIMALQHPDRFQEANPAGPVGVLIAKALMMGVSPFVIRELAKDGHDKLAKTLSYVLGAEGAIPAALNVRTMATTR